jgi:hypothetical protein
MAIQEFQGGLKTLLKLVISHCHLLCSLVGKFQALQSGLRQEEARRKDQLSFSFLWESDILPSTG